MPEQNVVLRHRDGREDVHVVSQPNEINDGDSFVLDGVQWSAVRMEQGPDYGVRALNVLICEPAT